VGQARADLGVEEGIRVGQVAEPGAMQSSYELCSGPTLVLSPSHSKNLNNSQSNIVSFPLSVEAQAQVSLNGSVPRQSGSFLGGGSLPPSSKPPSSLVSPSLRWCSSQ
jgi:hypothetical protein